MTRIRYLAAGLLCLTGIIHVVRLGIPQVDAAFVTMTVVFGVAYLVISGFLFGHNKTAYYFGAIVPLIALVGGMVEILTNPTARTMWMAFLITIDVVIVLSCFCLIKLKRIT